MKQLETHRNREAPDLLNELKCCRDLRSGRTIHANITERPKEPDIQVLNALVYMYGKCGSLNDARTVFDSILEPNVVHWTTLLSGYAQNGNAQAALELFDRMKSAGCVPDSVTYMAALKACTTLALCRDGGGKIDCLQRGREIHAEIGFHWNHFLRNTLVSMYSNCGSMVEAHKVFDSIQKPDVVSWNCLLLGYVENGQGVIALDSFYKMKDSGILPDSITYVAAIKALAVLAAIGNYSERFDYLERGRKLHLKLDSHFWNHYVQGALVDMYSKCGSMVEAHRVFDKIRDPDVVSWTALLSGYAENGEGRVVLDAFVKMKSAGCAPDSVAYVAVLKACGLIGALSVGQKLHLEIRDFTTHLTTALVDFYAKCGSMVESREVFDKHSKTRNDATWTALLAGYGRLGDSASAFKLFEAMQDDGLRPDAVTFVCLLLCCTHAGLIEKAREYFDAMPVQYGVTPTILHYTCMVDALGRRNQLNEAILMIRGMPYNPDVIIWTTLLGACYKWKNAEVGEEAFNALLHMNKGSGSSYILMAQIYGSTGMWEKQERLLMSRMKLQRTRKAEEISGT